ncbi:MAG: methionine biosynthesis protein MetW [Syntrophorhabdales bacterium]|jgi:methionine biosynthesis protein MetW
MKDRVDLRLDQLAVVECITPGASVLDLGCGDGELLAALAEEKQVRGQGIEIDDEAILRCVTRGLNVFHDDIDRGLSEYEDQSFDFVILNQTFQQVRKPEEVLKEALRVASKVIVGFPNFATLSTRFQLGIRGRTPVSPSLPYEWHDTPNLHFLSLVDFIDYCRKRSIRIERAFYFGAKKRIRFFPNVFAHVGVFLVTKG